MIEGPPIEEVVPRLGHEGDRTSQVHTMAQSLWEFFLEACPIILLHSLFPFSFNLLIVFLMVLIKVSHGRV